MNSEADKLVDQAFKGEPVIHATDLKAPTGRQRRRRHPRLRQCSGMHPE
jgi:hypothetical protein